MRLDIEVEVIAERRIDSLGVLPPFPAPSKKKMLFSNSGVDRRPSLREHADIEALSHKVRVVVDMNAFRLLSLSNP